MPLDLAAARKMRRQKTKRTIEIETAWKWASLAIVTYEDFAKKRALRLLVEAVDYEHEAVEHAGEGSVCSAVRKAIDAAKKRLGVDYGD